VVKLAPCPANPGNTYTKGFTTNASSSMEVKVFPNPTTSSFNFQVINNVSMAAINARVLDIQGRQVKTIKINPNETITLGSDFKSGVYMMEVYQGKEKKVVRVVKY
jgi:hypothetical protein